MFLWWVAFNLLLGHLMATPNSVRWLLRWQARLPSWPQWCHGALSQSRSGGLFCKAFGWRSAHSLSGVCLRSNGSMVDLSHERYLQWQQHKAPGTENIWCPRNPSFHWLKIGTTMQPRHVAVWSGVTVTVSATSICKFLNCAAQILRLGGAASLSPKPYVSSDRMSCQSSCVVMHFCRCNESVGIFLLPKAFPGRLALVPHTGFARPFPQFWIFVYLFFISFKLPGPKIRIADFLFSKYVFFL